MPSSLSKDYYRTHNTKTTRLVPVNYLISEEERDIINNLLLQKIPNSMDKAVKNSADESTLALISKLMHELYQREAGANFLRSLFYRRTVLRFKEEDVEKCIYLTTDSNNKACRIDKIPGGASNKQFYRISYSSNETRILMCSPQPNEVAEFSLITFYLRRHGMPVPEIYVASLHHDLVIMKDFGNWTLLDYLLKNKIPSQNLIEYYCRAIDMILQLQKINCQSVSVSSYTTIMLGNGIRRFKEYFIEGFLGLKLTSEEDEAFQNTMTKIVDGIKKQPQRLVHRDYQSTNIMIDKDELHIIDYQTLAIGHYTYDLVSLLRDCYYVLDFNHYNTLLEYFRRGFNVLNPEEAVSEAQFHQDIRYTIAHRHMLCPGIFANLYLKQNRKEYLRFIRDSFFYLLTAIEGDPELEALVPIILRIGYSDVYKESKYVVWQIFLSSSKLHFKIMVDMSKLIILTGTASSGKTSLALAYSEECKRRTQLINMVEVKLQIYSEFLLKKSPKDYQYFLEQHDLTAIYYITNIHDQEDLFIQKWRSTLSPQLVAQAESLNQLLLKDTTESFYTNIMYRVADLTRGHLLSGFTVIIETTDLKAYEMLMFNQFPNPTIVTLFCDLQILHQRIRDKNLKALSSQQPLDYYHPLLAYDQYFSTFTNQITEALNYDHPDILSVMTLSRIDEIMNDTQAADPLYNAHDNPIPYESMMKYKKEFYNKLLGEDLNRHKEDNPHKFVVTSKSVYHQPNSYVFNSATKSASSLAKKLEFIIDGPKTAFILAAGKGTRMNNTTIHKSLHVIGGVAILEHNILDLRNVGITSIYINLHHLHQQIIERIGDGSRYGVKIHYVYEKDILRPGGGVYNMFKIASLDNVSSFILLSADVWHNFDLASLKLKSDRSCHLILKTTNNPNLGFGFTLEEQGGVVLGKALDFQSIAFFKAEFFEDCKFEGAFGLDQLLSWGIQDKKISGEVFSGLNINVNTVDDLSRANDIFRELRKEVLSQELIQ